MNKFFAFPKKIQALYNNTVVTKRLAVLNLNQVYVI